MRILLVERSIYPRTLEQRNPIFDVFRKADLAAPAGDRHCSCSAFT
jgi:hypothetical protein